MYIFLSLIFLQNISEQLEDLERTKKEYIAKNHQQVSGKLFDRNLLELIANMRNFFFKKTERENIPIYLWKVAQSNV